MSIFYLDLENGNDANSGADWANAWKTITLGPTAARTSPGDVIRIAKSPVPISIGNGTWTDQPTTLPAAKNISSISDSGGVIKVQINTHGYSTGDCVYIQNQTNAPEANGTWKITVIDTSYFTLDGSVFVNTSTALGTAILVNRGVVQLTTAQTKTITRCQTAWTAVNSATVTKDTSYYKDGDASAKIVKASPTADTLYAFFPTGTLDLSAFQKISFWLYNSTAILVNQWKICLCSGADGTGIQDTILIPAIPSTSRWIPLTLIGSNANLYNGINSIAIYSGSAAASTTGIYLSNILACTSSGLNLQSLISKNTLEQTTVESTAYGNECWFPIRSISEDGKLITLDGLNTDQASQSVNTAGFGYTGVTETVTTYIRETIKIPISSSGTTQISVPAESGSQGSQIEYQFGFDTSTSLQTGETIVDGLNGLGQFIYLTYKNYLTFNKVSFCRLNYGFYLTYSNSIVINCSIVSSCFYGVNQTYGNYGEYSILTGCSNSTVFKLQAVGNPIVTNIVNITGCSGSAFDLAYQSNLKINYIGIISNAITGLYLNGVANSVLKSGMFKYCATAIQLTSCFKIKFRDFTITKSFTADISSTTNGENYFFNLVVDDNTKIISSGPNTLPVTVVYSENHNNTGFSWLFANYASMNSQNSTLINGSGKEWVIQILNAARIAAYPFNISLAKVYLAAGAITTVKLWMKKSHATNVIGRIICEGGQLAGLPNDIVATKDDNTTEEEVTLTVGAPTVDGVVEIQVQAYSGGGTGNIIFDKLSVSQAG